MKKIFLLFAIMLLLIGCGQSGPLYLPTKPVTPAPDASTKQDTTPHANSIR